MHDFEIGDIVFIKNKKRDGFSDLPSHGRFLKTIIGDGTLYYGIEFDDYIFGHSCGGFGKDGHCWFIQSEDILPISKVKNCLLKISCNFE